MELFSNIALLWFIAGAVFIILEFVIPGVFVLFFGLGAWVTALCVYLFEPSLSVQFLIFSIISVLSLILLRKVIMQRLYKKEEIDPDEEFVGRQGTCIVALGRGGEGKIEFKGTNWTATSESDICAGQKVRILKKEGLKLFVEPVN